jgi:hypothetical protein
MGLSDDSVHQQAIGEARRNGTLPHNPHAPSQAVGEFIVRVEAACGRA